MADGDSIDTPSHPKERLTVDDRTNAIGLFNYGHSYWASTSALQVADVEATHPDAPVNYLYFHSIELFLKAYLRATGMSVADLKRLRHGMTELTKEANKRGLELGEEDRNVLGHIQANYLPSRYIEIGPFQRATYDALWGTCSWLFDRVGEEIIRLENVRRLPDRPPHPNDMTAQ